MARDNTTTLVVLGVVGLGAVVLLMRGHTGLAPRYATTGTGVPVPGAPLGLTRNPDGSLNLSGLGGLVSNATSAIAKLFGGSSSAVATTTAPATSTSPIPGLDQAGGVNDGGTIDGGFYGAPADYFDASVLGSVDAAGSVGGVVDIGGDVAAFA